MFYVASLYFFYTSSGYGPTFYPASGTSARLGDSSSRPSLLLADAASKSASLRAPGSYGAAGNVDISSVRLLKDVADDLYGYTDTNLFTTT
jgi:hypothetical protein